jgi:hypothetical protein
MANKNSGIRLVGRPDRQKVIGDEDIMDLRIALATTKSVDEFLARLDGANPGR